MKFYEVLPELWIALGIAILIGIFLALSALFRNKKISDFLDNLAESIGDFFT